MEEWVHDKRIISNHPYSICYMLLIGIICMCHYHERMVDVLFFKAYLCFWLVRWHHDTRHSLAKILIFLVSGYAINIFLYIIFTKSIYLSQTDMQTYSIENMKYPENMYTCTPRSFFKSKLRFCSKNNS